MPIYEYRCNECDHQFEVLTSPGRVMEQVRCDKCNSDKVTKVISAGSFRSGAGISLPSASAGRCGGKAGFT